MNKGYFFNIIYLIVFIGMLISAYLNSQSEINNIIYVLIGSLFGLIGLVFILIENQQYQNENVKEKLK